jgi:signal transduction histidine kinase
MEAVRDSLFHLQPLPLAPVNVADCVAEALTASRLPAGVHVALAGLDGLPAVIAHPSGLALVFTNLLENAADALGGAGRVTIRGAARQGQVEVVVSDSGPGIAPELHERIFELSFSYRRTTAARAGKLGFGLWWVRTLMTRLGGTIGVVSDGQHGASFVLRLPCAARVGLQHDFAPATGQSELTESS